MTEYMREDNEFVEVETPRIPTPEDHYDWAMNGLARAAEGAIQDNGMDRTNVLLEALTHSVLAAVRDALNYSARHPSSPAVAPSPPLFEEDSDRP